MNSCSTNRSTDTHTSEIRQTFKENEKIDHNPSNISKYENIDLQMDDSSSTSFLLSHQRVKRTKFSEFQLQQLYEAFELESYPREETFEKLANDIGLSLRTVTVWFQNTRQKHKRESDKRKLELSDSDRAKRFSQTSPEAIPNHRDMNYLFFENPFNNTNLISNYLNMISLNHQNDNQTFINPLNSKKTDKIGNIIDKRLRTTISQTQVNQLLEIFKENNCPNGLIIREIASKVHLPKKVVQVWFQNARAREKKMKNNKSPTAQEKIPCPESLEKTNYPDSLGSERIQDSINSSTSEDYGQISKEISASDLRDEVGKIPKWKLMAVNDVLDVNNCPSDKQLEILVNQINTSEEIIKYIVRRKETDNSKIPKNVAFDEFCLICNKATNDQVKNHVYTVEHITNLLKKRSNENHITSCSSGNNNVVQNIGLAETNNLIYSQMPYNILINPAMNSAFLNFMNNYCMMAQNDVKENHNCIEENTSDVKNTPFSETDKKSSGKFSRIFPDFVIRQICERYIENSPHSIFYTQNNERISDLTSKLDDYQQYLVSSAILKTFFHCKKCDELFTEKNNFETHTCRQIIYSEKNCLRSVVIHKIGWMCLPCEIKYEKQSDLHHHILYNHDLQRKQTN